MPYTPDNFANFASSTIAGGAGGAGTSLASGDTSLLLQTGDGAKFPSVAPFMVLLGSISGTHELVKCTARASDTLTIVRGQESTTAQLWALGISVQQIVTSGNLANLGNELRNLLRGVYNVRDYGAVGDGVTDDSAAIQAAINQTGLASPAAPSATGNTGAGSAFTAGQTVHVATTYVTASGETGSQDTLVTIGSNGNNVVVTLPGAFPASVTGMNVYASTATGSTTLYKVTAGAGVTSSTPGAAITITGFAPNTNAVLPSANTTGTAGVIYFPAGTYNLVAAGLVVAQDNVELRGDGWSTQLLAGAAMTMLTVQPPGGVGRFRYGLQIRDLYLNGNNVASVNGLDLFSCYGAVVEHVRCRYILGTSVHWDGISGAFGAYNYLVNSHITDGGTTGYGVKTDSSEWLTIEGCQFGYYSGGTAVAVYLSNLNNKVIGTSFDHNDTSVLVAFAGRNIIANCQFDRGYTRFIYLESAANCIVSGNFFGVRSGTGPEIIRADGANNDKSLIIGNTVEATSGWPLFAQEYGGIGGVNTYTDNDTAGLALTLLTGIARGNHGYNPVGHAVAQPAVPASTVAQTNTTGVDCTVYVTGGTVSAVAVGGTSTGLTSGAFRVPAGQTITLTYSAAPTWQWFGD